MLLRAKSSWVLKNLCWWRFHSILEPYAPVLYQSSVEFLFLYIQLEYLLLKFASVGSCPSFKKSLPLSSPQFLKLSRRQQFDFSLVFSSPGWINLVWWTPCRSWWPIPQLAGFEVPVVGSLLSILTAFPRKCHPQCGTGSLSSRALEQVFSCTSPIWALRSATCWLDLDSSSSNSVVLWVLCSHCRTPFQSVSFSLCIKTLLKSRQVTLTLLPFHCRRQSLYSSLLCAGLSSLLFPVTLLFFLSGS